ncbi:hypothetical protein HDIA_0731 [Hartmannibacter diazotrophicus]|uniref:Uncharacterized protein n=1 Tax=Hartmannibacter diazotrophicus TaxID=1482074 RepID=A0A2C9D1S2_9HYPH|nr:hypothetical protein [Hartmannibacter diazotrophicus]SON54272.1 hypothetical protein HDIA_0731 [Hartmannibacter diazotrophicus]
MKNPNLFSGAGVDCNRVKIGGRTDLLGDPNIKPEKPHTIIGFPGGDVEIARTSDGNYWVHVAVRHPVDDPLADRGKIIGARIDFDGRYGDEANRVLRKEVAAGDVTHIAFLVAQAQS